MSSTKWKCKYDRTSSNTIRREIIANKERKGVNNDATAAETAAVGTNRKEYLGFEIKERIKK